MQVPVISVIVGEGGSGGAVALAIGNRVLMLEHAIYSVISPEGCAAILWRTSEKTQEAAEALKLTAQDLLQLEVIDRVIDEPTGGAQRHPKETIARVGDALSQALAELDEDSGDGYRALRREKFLAMGKVGLA